MMNQVLFSGRIVAVQPPKQLEGDMVVASVTLANDVTYDGKTTTTTVRVDFWGKAASQVALAKEGDSALISGKLKSKAKTMNDGTTFYGISITGSSLSLLRGDESPAPMPRSSEPPTTQPTPQAPGLDVPF